MKNKNGKIIVSIVIFILFGYFGCEDEPETTFSVIYNTNGADSGSVPIDGNNYIEGESITVLDNSGQLLKSTYNFICWNTAVDGSGTMYYPGDILTMINEDITLFAYWEKKDIYIVGILEDRSLCYWENGEPNIVIMPSESTSIDYCDIYVNGGSIYIAGVYGNGTNSVPFVWKDGNMTTLEIPSSNGSGYIYDICVSNDNVYIVGSANTETGSMKPCYWENGELYFLSQIHETSEGYAHGVFLENDDLYISGYTTDSSGYPIPCYWKNGTRTDFSGYIGEADSIAAKNNDIYVTGYYYDTINEINVPCFWLNSTLYDLPRIAEDKGIEYTWSGITITDHINIVSNCYDESDNVKPCQWIDGELSVLSVNSDESMNIPFSIYSSGFDIYISGIVDNNKPCFWENGILLILNYPDKYTWGFATGISVE